MQQLYFIKWQRFIVLSILVLFSLIGHTQSANFNINNNSQCLTGNNFVFTNTSSVGATAYLWNFGDGSTSTTTNPTKSYSAYGTYSVQLIATIAGTNYYINKNVEVNAEPVCGFTYYVATGTGNSYSFQSTSSIGSGSMNYSWNFGDGGTATSSNPSHTYASIGNYVVTLTVTSDKGCVCNSIQNVAVVFSLGGSTPNLSFTTNDTIQCLTGNSFSFNNTTVAISGATYRWTFGDGGTSNAGNPNYTYLTAGTYIVNLIATISGTDYFKSQIVTVVANPSVIISGVACIGSILTTSSIPAIFATIEWKNGATIVQTNTQTFTPISIGTYTATITSNEGCSAISNSIIINPVPPVNAITGASNVSEGNSITLANTTIGGTWSSGNLGIATINLSGVVTGVSAGTVTINYTVNNCGFITNVTKQILVTSTIQNFITQWDLSTSGSGATQLSFGTATSGTVNYNWQEISPGTSSGSGSWSGSTLTITGLPTGAIIRLEIWPTNFQRININNGIDRNRITHVNQWGSTVWTSMETAFFNCANLQVTATDIPNLSGVTNMSQMFRNCTNLNSPININSWNTSSITNMSNLFASASSFNQNIGSWNTAAVTNMEYLFASASSFNQNIGSWNTTAVSNMSGMFYNASVFNQNIGLWNTGAVTNMESMFFLASAFNNSGSNSINNWNTAAVTNMNHMFRLASAFNQNIGSWNTVAVTNMSGMFYSAGSFNNGGSNTINNWNTGAVTNMSDMFTLASAFNQSIGSWNTASVTNMNHMFRGASAFNQNIGSWNTTAVTKMFFMFELAIAFNNGGNSTINNWNTAAVTTMSSMFSGASSFNQNISSWNTSSVTNMIQMFNGASSFNQNIGTWSLNPGVSMTNMFDNSGMDCVNYSSTLMGWNANPSTPNSRSLGANGMQYGTNAVAARTNLLSSKFWTITGDVAFGSHCGNSNFVTQWNLATSGSGATQLSFGTATTGTVNYIWQEISPGTASGSGSWSGSTLTITGLPSGALIRLEITPTNFRRIIVNNGADRNRLTQVENWGSTAWSSMELAFHACTNLQVTATDVPNLAGVTNMENMFRNCINLNSPANINSWNTASVTNMSNLFAGASSFNQNIGNWNTSAVINLREMFAFASSFNQNIGAWNTGVATTMQLMFFGASSFNNGGNNSINDWNTSSVLNMHGLFRQASSFNQNIGSWNTSAVTDMARMFLNASAFNNGGSSSINNWNTANVITMNGMFQVASSFNQNIGSWNTANVSAMIDMFTSASAFNQSIGSWTLNASVNLSNMLNFCGMNCSNYSSTLIGWNANPSTPNSRSLGATFGMQYGSHAIAARANLVLSIGLGGKGWTITGDALVSITPTFTAVSPICTGDLLSALPTTSNNGITGTWTPALNNTITTTYAFTPNIGQCATITNLTIIVNTKPNAGINQTTCNGSIKALIGTANTGTWTAQIGNPIGATLSATITGVATATFSNTAIGVFNFIYTVGSCTDTMSVSINPNPTINLTGGGACANLLTANITGGTASSLIWSLNGTPQDTVFPTYNPSATTVAGGSGAGSAADQLDYNVGIALDAQGSLYVVDHYNHRVQKFAAGSTTGVTVAGGNGVGNAANQLNYPSYICFDANNNLYVSDNLNHRVQKFAPGSTTGVTVAGGNGDGNAANQLSNPFGIFLDSNNNLYVSDLQNFRVQKWASGATSGIIVAGGNGQGNAANQLSHPTGIFVDAAANVYIADGVNYRVQKWAAGATNGITVAGITGIGGPPDSAHLSVVTNVVVDAIGSIYISDHFNRIVRWQEGASYGTTLVGSNFSGGSGSTELQIPYSLLFATNGDLYVSDFANHRVQKFTIAALTNTFTPTATGTYSVTANSFAGCTSTVSTVVSSLGVVPTISISAGVVCGNATICAGSSITFNSSITNGGASPTIQWKVNGSNVATGASFTTSSLNNNDIVTAVLTSNAACPSPNPVTSNSITITTKAAPTVTITGSGCTGSSLSLTGTGLAGSSITWLVGGVPIAASAPSIDTNAVTVAGNLLGGNGSAQLNNPQGIFVDTNNNLYIADFYNNRVQKWANGASSGTTIAGGNGQGLASNQTGGYGLYVDKNNNLYTVDFLHRVQKWTPSATNGILVAGTGFSGSSATELSLPKSVYIDDCGNMYVADTYNHRVQKFNNGSTVGVTVAGTGVNGNSATQLSHPTHVQVDAQGNIYVADNSNDRIQKFAAGSLTATTVAGTGVAGNLNNQLNNPWGMYVDGGGNMYVADTYNNRIMYWATGATTGVKIAGTGNYGNGANGLNFPTDVFIDANANLFVCDAHNNRIQKFNAIAPTAISPLTTGTYTAIVTNAFGCTSTSNPITVSSCVVPTFSFNVNSLQQCITSNNFVFTNTSTAPSGTTYLWTFGDGVSSTSFHASHTYLTNGYYNVTLKATYNGIDYYSNQQVIVKPLPVASFTQYFNSPLTYTFNSTSTISSGSISSYAWNFGDGGTGTTSNPQHTFASAGTYNVKLVVTSDAGCKDSITTAVIISTTSGGGGSTPTPTFTVNTAQQCVTGNSFVFTNTSIAPSGTTYLWNFGDGTSSTASSPTHVYSTGGNYFVQMIATYAGQNYYANGQGIVVGAKPVASFNVVAGTGSGNAHTFISTSTIASGNMSYAWSFGDGGTSTLISPQHIYATAGTFNVKLVVTSDLGCKDSITQIIVVCPTLITAFSINSASSCFVGNYFGVLNFSSNNLGYPMTFLWNYGDGFTSTLQNPPLHNYSAVGTYNISLTTTLSYPGCAVQNASYNVQANVFPMPVASFNISGSPTTMCYTPTNNYTFNNTSTIASGSIFNTWDFGDTTFSTVYSPSHTYSHAGRPNLDADNSKIFIKLVATSVQGCKDSITNFIKLHNLPIATNLIISSVRGGAPDRPLSRNSTPFYVFHSRTNYDTIQCFNGFNWFSNTVSGISTSPGDFWKVNFDDGSSGIGGTFGHGAPYNMYTSAGTHLVNGNIVSSNGCLSNTVYGTVILTPNTDTLPHSVIGIHAQISTNVGIDPFSNSYNNYKLFFAHLGSTACRPIIASYWRISYLSGNPYWNHGYFDFGPYIGLLPTPSDSVYFSFNADSTNTFQIRLITVNDLGMADTAYANFGASNNGYTNYKTLNGGVAIAKRNIGVYPNPSVNEVKVAVKLEKNYHTKLIVYNSYGQVVLTTKQYLFGNIVEEVKLNTRLLNQGTYFVQIVDDKNKVLANTKFIKSN